jgi:hypothetical protein
MYIILYTVKKLQKSLKNHKLKILKIVVKNKSSNSHKYLHYHRFQLAATYCFFDTYDMLCCKELCFVSHSHFAQFDTYKLKLRHISSRLDRRKKIEYLPISIKLLFYNKRELYCSSSTEHTCKSLYSMFVYEIPVNVYDIN